VSSDDSPNASSDASADGDGTLTCDGLEGTAWSGETNGGSSDGDGVGFSSSCRVACFRAEDEGDGGSSDAFASRGVFAAAAASSNAESCFGKLSSSLTTSSGTSAKGVGGEPSFAVGAGGAGTEVSWCWCVSCCLEENEGEADALAGAATSFSCASLSDVAPTSGDADGESAAWPEVGLRCRL